MVNNLKVVRLNLPLPLYNHIKKIAETIGISPKKLIENFIMTWHKQIERLPYILKYFEHTQIKRWKYCPFADETKSFKIFCGLYGWKPIMCCYNCIYWLYPYGYEVKDSILRF
mgnify:CR=1 FL=1